MARRSKRAFFAIVVLLVAALAVPFINVNRFRGRIVTAISQALGREVTAGAVSLRLIPQPGFVLENVTISDDPAYSNEAMLRAESVAASLRLTSLWRGRLEIAKLSLTYPSLNLVRTPEGHWNLEALFARGAQTQAAPTGKPQAETRLRFPYVEADGARINFKFGTVKSPFVVNDADFSLWLATDTKWEMRLEGRPVRTDLDAFDAGTIEVRGSFEKASDPWQMPLNLRVTLEDAQLGGITKLIYGRDRGWRGNADLDVTFLGRPAALNIAGEATLRGFRRYDIVTEKTPIYTVRCAAHFTAGDRTTTERDLLTDLDCRMPADAGEVALVGGVGDLFGQRFYDLNITLGKVPLARVADTLRHMKRDVADDLTAGGELNAAFTLRSTRQGGEVSSRWEGGGRTSAMTLQSAALGNPLELPAAEFEVAPAELATADSRTRLSALARRRPRSGNMVLSLSPVTLRLGGTAPLVAGGWFGRTDYRLQVRGGASLPRLLNLGRALGLRPLHTNVDGSAELDLVVRGAWQGFASPATEGTARVRNVVAEIAGVNVPAVISAADLELTPAALSLRNMSLQFRGTPTSLTGWITVDRQCNVRPDCMARFQLTADDISSDDLNALLNPAAEKRFWQIFTPSRKSLAWMAGIKAQGKLAAARVRLGSLAMTNVTADVGLASSVLRLQNLQGRVFGGTHRGHWLADFRLPQAQFTGEGSFESVQLTQAAALATLEPTATGLASGNYQVKLAGLTRAELARTAAGQFDFNVREGTFFRVPVGGSPLRFREWTGRARIAEGRIELRQSKIQGSGGILVVSGSATMQRELDLRLSGDSGDYRVTGTLERPQVARTRGEQTAQRR